MEVEAYCQHPLLLLVAVLQIYEDWLSSRVSLLHLHQRVSEVSFEFRPTNGTLQLYGHGQRKLRFKQCSQLLPHFPQLRHHDFHGQWNWVLCVVWFFSEKNASRIVHSSERLCNIQPKSNWVPVPVCLEHQSQSFVRVLQRQSERLSHLRGRLSQQWLDPIFEAERFAQVPIR